ncbi:MAG: O-antigen ligase family protein, partial [Syntrophales bacterium LBB04]|nr:O-antigen ligase family protein [Syntrophales bacterium LBB04]
YFEAFILLMAFWVMGGPYHSLTYSATATIGLFIGLSVFGCLYRKSKRGAVAYSGALSAFILSMIIYGIITPMVGKLSIIDVASTVGRQDNLTGRSDVWQQLVPAAMTRPALGSGYGGFWTTRAREIYDIPTAHNGYLENILELGFVGLLLFSTFLLSNGRKAQRMMIQDFYWGALWICYLIMAIANNITESTLNSIASRMMATILFFAISSMASTSDIPKVPLMPINSSK